MEGTSHQHDLGNWQPLIKKIENLKQLSSEACIFRVQPGLRRTNPEAYTPLVISIGPYHHGKPELSEMEKMKERYLQSFINRGQGSFCLEECWKKLKDLKGRAESYYADEDLKLNGDKFVEMLLLDGCFVVEFIVRYRLYSNSFQELEYDPIFRISGTVNNVVRDMLLLENQLPFFVLQQLYEKINQSEPEEFSQMVISAFAQILPKLNIMSVIFNEIDTQEIKHLLQVVHIICRPPNSEPRPNTNGSDIESGQLQQSTCFSRQPQAGTDERYVELGDIRTASELQEAGVDFKKVGNTTELNTSLFDIKFNHSVLEIPSFKLYDIAEVFFRNLIAYEQHYSPNVCPNYFTSFAIFMDGLINTEKDVIALRRKGIFVNGLGDDVTVTNLFNNLCREVLCYPSHFYYRDVNNKLIQHCNKPWNLLKAKLRRDYFHSPWAGISTIAAIWILSLATAQTVTAVLALLK